MPESIININANFPNESFIKTEDIDLGWKKTGAGFDQWEPKTLKKK